MEAIPAGSDVQSVIIGKLTMTEMGCVPKPPVVPEKITWGLYAKACEGSAVGSCEDPSQVCSPPVADGFKQCVSQKGDNSSVPDCPDGYPTRHTLYLGANDTRGCSSCTCGTPQGSKCASMVSVFTDAACSDPVTMGTVTEAAPSCHDVPVGSPLGSKSATTPVYAPGTCAPSGGEVMGAVAPIQPITFCCRP